MNGAAGLPALPHPWHLIGLREAVLLAGGLMFSASVGRSAEPDADQIAFFETKIRPVLVEHCYSCHSAEADQKNKLKAELFLDSKDGWRRGGESGPAIVPGNAKESLLLQAIRHEDLEMPPKKPKLSDAIIADFEKWVAMGAVDPRVAGIAKAKHGVSVEEGRGHWSFQPLRTPALPQAAISQVSGWRDRTNVVDQFILAAQQAKGLSPSPRASKEVIARRVFFDLTGLPPSEQELNEFLTDAAPDAYPKLVDRLLASPRYGERWGRHWLDLVRFAESGGYEFDRERAGAYHYRDWVIKSLNKDMPYDEFVRLQVAGDKIKPKDYLAGSATGFLVAGPFPGQLTAKTKEPIRYDQLDDMIDTLGQSMLGLSLGCARCHTHKFDPIPHQDYYSMLASIGRTGAVNANLDPNPALHRKAKEKWKQEHEPFAAMLAQFFETEFPRRLTAWKATPEAKATPAHWQWLDWTDLRGGAANLEKRADGVVSTSANRNPDAFILSGETRQTGITAFLLDLPADRMLKMGGPGMLADGGFDLRELEITATPLDSDASESPIRTKLRVIAASSEKEGKPAADAVDGNDTSQWGVAGQGGKSQFLILGVEGAPLGFPGGTKFEVRLFFANARGAARMRVGFHSTASKKKEPEPKANAAAAAESPSEAAETKAEPVAAEKEDEAWIATVNGNSVMQNAAEVQAILERDKKATAANRAELARWLRIYDQRIDAALTLTESHERLAPQPATQAVFSAGINDLNIGPVQWLGRGEVTQKKGVAEPGYLQVLSRAKDNPNPWQKPKEDPRVGLARWLADAESGAGNLLARVQANRLWHYHFGRGLVATPNDFGFQGDRPTHPELLEWLASELVRGGWKLKPLHRLIATSAAYQQAAANSETNERIDPDNRLWWRRSPRRLEAETLRDSLLYVAGKLDETRFGRGTLDDQKSTRRSIYLTVKRSQPVPFLHIFDAPEGIQSQGNRAANTMPTQALALMNSPWVRGLAVDLAKRIRKDIGPDASTPAALGQLHRIALGREVTADEAQGLIQFMEKQQALLAPAEDAAERAFQEACLLVLSCNEFLYVD